VRYQTTAELEAELARHLPQHDALVMGAAVADYRPRHDHGDGKLRRERDGLVLELESTPDLLAGCSAARQRDGRVDDLLLVGFALEPREALLDSAAAKLRRKGVDAIVANPLETMDGDTIDAILLDADGTQTATPGVLSKPDFARWLLERLRERVRAASA
jgi:phosphopantothenoylcysteine decarboxylase/phosphopantothenate--cysteine ligase